MVAASECAELRGEEMYPDRIGLTADLSIRYYRGLRSGLSAGL